MAANNQGKSERGFASMNDEKQREIASKGGKAAHEKGTAHEFTPEEAREAGRKGGETVSKDREHMAEIGREGGRSSHGGSNDQSSGSNQERGGSHEQHVKAGQQSHKNR
jgi:general stress protein YciG